MTPEQIADIYYDDPPDVAWAKILPLATTGDSAAQFYMGQLCDEQTPPDQVEAVAWYQKSSDNGFPEGTHHLASFTYHGMGTHRNVEKAIALFRISAEAGLDASQWKLGQHFLSIAGRQEEAINWLRRAAAQGHSAAIDLLSEEGAGV